MKGIVPVLFSELSKLNFYVFYVGPLASLQIYSAFEKIKLTLL